MKGRSFDIICRWPAMPDMMGQVATLAAPGQRDRGDVDLLHRHHRIKCAFCFIAASGWSARKRQQQIGILWA